LHRQPAPGPLAGRESEEHRVVQFAVQQADAAVVAAAAVLAEIPFPDDLAGFQVPGPDPRAMILRIERDLVGIDPAHYLAAAGVDRVAAERERLLGPLGGILTRTGG